MQVLVDTSIWSLALRKSKKSKLDEDIISFLSKLIRELKVVMIGPIRQEILSGISDNKRYVELKNSMSIFHDWSIKTLDYELAAKFFNTCRKNGIQGSHIDFLLCAFAVNNDLSILTLDNDFFHYQKYIDIKLIERKNV